MLQKVEPYIIAWPGRKESTWYATIGDNLNDKPWEWNPPIELNCSKMWGACNQNFERFVRFLDECLLHEYLHIAIRLEATKPPGGTGSIPFEWKGNREEEGIWKLTFLLLSYSSNEVEKLWKSGSMSKLIAVNRS